MLGRDDKMRRGLFACVWSGEAHFGWQPRFFCATHWASLPVRAAAAAVAEPRDWGLRMRRIEGHSRLQAQPTAILRDGLGETSGLGHHIKAAALQFKPGCT
jgi:peptide methionine sulfoxide reductase MsrB